MKVLFVRVLVIALWGILTPVQASTDLQVFTEISPPYQYLSNNQVEGIATQKVKNILAQAGVSAELKAYPWARAIKHAERTSRGLIYSMAKTPERQARFVWIAPVATFELGILTLTSSQASQFSLPLNSAELSVAAQRDDIAAKWLLEQGFVEGKNLMLCADILCSWQQLKLGTVDFIIEDPNLIEVTAGLAGLNAKDVVLQHVIPDLSITAYLAANKDMEASFVKRLRKAARELGYQ